MIHGHTATHKPTTRLIHSSCSNHSGLETHSTRSTIEKTATMSILAPAIHDVFLSNPGGNPNNHGDTNKNTPNPRLITSTAASASLFRCNMVTSLEARRSRARLPLEHARKLGTLFGAQGSHRIPVRVLAVMLCEV